MNELVKMLRWAKRKKLYIEIYGDGSADVQWDNGQYGVYRLIGTGPTLLRALRNAKKNMEKEKQA